jgi:DNA adenine methylase
MGWWKAQLLQQLYESAPAQFDRYFEPSLGGGVLFFYLISVRAEKFVAYLSDINSELINSYNIVKNNIEELIVLLKKHEIEYQKSSSKYYQLRELLDQKMTLKGLLDSLLLTELVIMSL